MCDVGGEHQGIPRRGNCLRCGCLGKVSWEFGAWRPEMFWWIGQWKEGAPGEMAVSPSFTVGLSIAPTEPWIDVGTLKMAQDWWEKTAVKAGLEFDVSGGTETLLALCCCQRVWGCEDDVLGSWVWETGSPQKCMMVIESEAEIEILVTSPHLGCQM